MRRILIATVMVVGLAGSASAQTLTVRDILELTKAGLNESALLALVDVHKAVFPVDKETLLMLKAEGVSDNVIVAMIRSGREPRPLPPPDPLPPTQALIVDRGDGTQPLIVKERPDTQSRVVVVETPQPRQEERRVREVVEERVREVPVPVYVPVPIRSRDRDERPDPPKAASPVYWGFDGKPRPDSWQTPPVKKPETKPETKKND